MTPEEASLFFTNQRESDLRRAQEHLESADYWRKRAEDGDDRDWCRHFAEANERDADYRIRRAAAAECALSYLPILQPTEGAF